MSTTIGEQVFTREAFDAFLKVLRPWRKPLIVMSPKSLLRHPHAVSSLEEHATGEFERVIPDGSVEPSRVRRVLLCSGKVYYDLLQRREQEGRDDVAILRVEQHGTRGDAY